MREDLNHNDFADDVSGAKKGVDIHNEVKKKIHKMPIENIDSMGQRLLQRYITRMEISIFFWKPSLKVEDSSLITFLRLKAFNL